MPRCCQDRLHGHAPALHPRPRPLRRLRVRHCVRHDVPPLRAQRPGPPADLARAVAQLRRRPPPGHPARHPAPRVRPRRHPLRPRQQLRPALRQRRGQLRHPLRAGLPAVPRRADPVDQGRLRHVAGPLRAGRRRAQVRAREPRPVAGADGRGLRRHLLQPPLRPHDTARGDDGGARHGRPLREGALRRHLLLRPGAHPRGRPDPGRAGDAAADPPAVVLDAQPLDRGASCSTCWAGSASAASRSPRWRRAC